MYNINFKKIAFLLTTISIFFLGSCSSDSNASNGSCPLDSMVDDYQVLADKLKSAMDSNDFNTIMSTNQDVAAWLKKWESASSDAADNCSLQDITSATNRMQAIASSLMNN